MNFNEFRSLRWIDFFMYALTDPRALYRVISKNGSSAFVFSFIVPVLLVMIEVITVSLCKNAVGAFMLKISYGWLLGSLLLMLSIVINASLMDFMAQEFGYKGNIKEKIIVLNFALFPKFFIMPCLYIFYVLNFAIPFFYVFFSIVLAIWSLVVVIQGISEMHSADLGKSMLIVFFPVVLLAISCILIITLFSLLLVGLISG